ncbi:MBL fold metallo-hydrolase [Shewanella aquimarina]|uniref:MBL fold metallo-hydrolase n=1 Tax=Shewanella aquimarina TaxID=260365 RepID=UPI002014B1F3|nr:MBL fold metallo-hydrolase [Shewanella aquimarina]MCL2910268.1 MBL fold metallo-hydrolase [Shewanella aquimarina]
MNNILRLALAGLLIGNYGTSLGCLAADDKFAEVEITATKLTEQVYMLSGAGGNIGVSAGEDGLLIIDDQFAPLADKISAALANIQPGKPKYIVNTHYHGDHTGGNSIFGQQGIIFAHDNVLKRLASDEDYSKQALPSITYDQGIKIHFNDDTLSLMYLPAGHTDGDSVIFWRDAPVVHMGDLFFKDRFPFIDLKAGGSVGGFRDNVATLLAKIDDEAKIIPGHGGLANKQDLIKFKQMLDTSIDWMNTQLKSGKSLGAIKQQGLPEALKQWEWQFISQETWIETLYNGLKAN